MSIDKNNSTFAVADFDQWAVVVDHCVNLIKPKTIFLLDGDLGSGKTTLVSLLTKKMGYTGDVSSPTYAITHTYQIDQVITIQHIDLYRLETEDEIEASGFWDLFSDEHNTLFIEWSSRIDQENWPLDWTMYRLQINKQADQKRIVTVTPI